MVLTSDAENRTNGSVQQEPSPVQPLAGERLINRIFIGPMPERVISHAESQSNQKKKITIGSVFSLTLDSERASKATDKTEEIARLAKAHAFRFFLQDGGDEAHWDARQEESTVEELIQRWKDSEWGRLWSRRHDRRKQTANTPHWFGTSFEIGSFLGVNVLQDQGHIHVNGAHSTEAVDSRSTVTEGSHRGGMYPPVSPASTNFGSSYSRSFSLAQTSYMASNYGTARTTLSNAVDDVTSAYFTPASSQTRLLGSNNAPPRSGRNMKAESQPNLPLPIPPKDVLRTQSDMPAPLTSKGKGRMVHYEFAPLERIASSSSIDKPEPPERVLQRQRSSLAKNTSSAAAADAAAEAERVGNTPPTELPDDDDDVVLRDRMLVRVSYSKQEGISHFDEVTNRTTRNLKYEDWGEFLVAWRKDSIEIYRDHNTPGKEWLTGHKHLSYVIPLSSSKTKLSLFSFIDLTFCITCAPTIASLNTERSRWNFVREKEGTSIFVFKVKSRSRAYDWIWKLWRSMGGQLPPAIDIYNPRLDAKITIDIPEIDPKNEDEYCPTFSRRSIIEICTNSLYDVPDWKYFMDEQIKKGHSLELAWRSMANLDWIWLENDVTGKLREWHVLCGLALRQLTKKPPSLEIRLAPHESTVLYLRSGSIQEPPSIEGYLDRIKPNSQTKQSIYVSVHSGYLYLLHSMSAFPPMPPGLNSFNAGNIDSQIQNMRQSEIRRGLNQITNSMSMLDLRVIIAVRRATHPTAPHTHNHEAGKDEDTVASNFTSGEPATADDEGDRGGEEGLASAPNRSTVRMRRSFELLLKTGQVYRFEAHSCQHTIEWITRLRALIFYWKQRHRIEAKQEIELAQAQKPRLTPLTRAHFCDQEQPHLADLSSPFAAMNSLYNWCILEGCKPAVKRGRVYTRKGLHGQYKLVQLCLVAGHLVRFRISGSSPLYPVMRKKFNLLDAYVCSGYLAEQCLPAGQYNPNDTPAPRRYQDGLETDDRDEDMIFMIWYRPQPAMFDAKKDPTTASINSKAVPSISAKNKVLIFKTRSVFERDAWCYAINSEIEKISRTQQRREDMLREAGNLVSLTE